jgi:DNA polymerase-3 subunit delta'
LCGTTLRIEAQNSLLKVLEEPPKNIVFIIITLSKSSILPTIFSRISCQFLKKKENINEFMYNLNNLDLKDVYELTKNNMRITKNEAREIIQSILNKAYKQNINLSPAQLDSFSMSLKLLHLNSRPINILTFVLLNFISNNKK